VDTTRYKTSTFQPIFEFSPIFLLLFSRLALIVIKTELVDLLLEWVRLEHSLVHVLEKVLPLSFDDMAKPIQEGHLVWLARFFCHRNV
jgi:hypothetical protein